MGGPTYQTAAEPPRSVYMTIGQPHSLASQKPMAAAQAKAATPTQNIHSGMYSSSLGLKTRSVPIFASKYSLKDSTPTTDRKMPKKPSQKTPVRNCPSTPYAHAA